MTVDPTNTAHTPPQQPSPPTVATARLVTTVTVTFTFEAAHQLSWHPGKCARLHGHSYTLEVEISGPLNTNGVIADFADIKNTVRTHVLDHYDHNLLNELMDNPTAENIANDATQRLLAADLPVRSVKLWETSTAAAIVYIQ